LSDTNQFRHALRRERLAHGLSQDALGAQVFVSGSQIGNYESGKSVPPSEVVKGLDEVLGTGTELQQHADKARGEAVAPWLRSWKENEERAVIVRTFQPNLIPGLLQTEDYARTVIAAGPHSPLQVDEMTRERMERQAKTLERPDPVTLTAILGEAALHHGGTPMMQDQLRHLVEVGRRPNVHVRIVPFTAGLHAGLTGAFAIATLPDGSPVVYLDTLVEGEVGTRMRDVHYAATVWEGICGRALPCELSRDLILRVIHEHEQRTKLA
jgi:transcriptional regulator with XRE-family HTH domain